MKLNIEKKYLLAGITGFAAIACAILFYYLVFHVQSIKNGIGFIFSVIMPVVNGLIIAYIMTPTLKFIEEKIFTPLLKKCSVSITYKTKRRIRMISILLTCVFFWFIIYAIISMLISQIVPSIQNIANNFDGYVVNLLAWVNRLFEDNAEITNMMQTAINNYSAEFKNWLNTNVLSQTSLLIKSVSLSVISFLRVAWNLIIGFVISIYLMSNKETLAGQAKKIIFAIFKLENANMVIREIRYVNRTFIGFIVGKIIDSVVIGLLCFLGTSLIGTPYPALVSVIIGVTNIIPFFGPYLGAIPCAIFILIVDFSNPVNCLYFILFILILQQIDGNIIGPKILGDSTGLSAFWVIFSITVFGGLMGVPGMIIGVPTFAVFYNLIRRIVERALKKKDLPTETAPYLKVGSIDSEGDFSEYVPEEKVNILTKNAKHRKESKISKE